MGRSTPRIHDWRLKPAAMHRRRSPSCPKWPSTSRGRFSSRLEATRWHSPCQEMPSSASRAHVIWRRGTTRPRSACKALFQMGEPARPHAVRWGSVMTASARAAISSATITISALRTSAIRPRDVRTCRPPTGVPGRHHRAACLRANHRTGVASRRPQMAFPVRMVAPSEPARPGAVSAAPETATITTFAPRIRVALTANASTTMSRPRARMLLRAPLRFATRRVVAALLRPMKGCVVTRHHRVRGRPSA